MIAQTIIAAAAVYGVSVDAILSKSRADRQAVLARHAVAWALRYDTDLTLTQIGELLDRDHTTIRASIARAEGRAVRNSREALRLSALLER